jgi:hypothetical protein
MRSREILATWLICAVKNSEEGSERYTFTSDPVDGGDIVHDTKTGRHMANRTCYGPSV